MRIMRSFKNIFIVLLALLLLGGGVLAWNQNQELIKLRALAGSASDRADLQRRLADLEKRLKASQDQLAAARARQAEDQPDNQDVAGADANNPGGGGGRRGGRFGGFQAMLNNPQVQKLMSIQMKAQLDGRYAALFKTLNLAPEQLDQFKNLLVQKQQAQQDARMAALQQGINPRTDPQAFQQAVASAQAAVDAQIQAQLGPDAYAQYQQYQQTLPARNTITQVQQSLSYTSTPLSDDQANQLVQILAQNAGQGGANGGGGGGRNGGGGGFGGGFGGGGNPVTPITNQVITEAQAILAPQQIQALQQLQQQQQAQQQMQQLIRAAGRQNGNGG